MLSDTKSGYADIAACAAKCRSNTVCAWVGFRHSDNYCEFWGVGSCQNPITVNGHDIYEISGRSIFAGMYTCVCRTVPSATTLLSTHSFAVSLSASLTHSLSARLCSVCGHLRRNDRRRQCVRRLRCGNEVRQRQKGKPQS